jgi:hypothetical protein
MYGFKNIIAIIENQDVSDFVNKLLKKFTVQNNLSTNVKNALSLIEDVEG